MKQTPPSLADLLCVHLESQTLQAERNGKVLRLWSVSTALNGPGELDGSGCTPRGEHRIRIGIGQGAEPGAVFVGRRLTGEIYSDSLAAQFPNRDWILSRILWLTGTESGRNRGWNAQGQRVDTLRRYIYIHGTPDTEPMRVAKSHGCIRMRNADVIALFDMVKAGTRVIIE